MEQNLRQFLLNTVNPNNEIRNEAEGRLLSASTNQECMYLIHKVLLRDSNPLLRQIASLFFVNSLRKNWTAQELAELTGELEENILDLIATADAPFRKMYLDIVQVMYSNRKQRSIDGLLHKAGAYMGSPDMARRSAALLVIEGLFKNETIRYNLDGPLSIIFDNYGSVFTRCFSEALASNELESACKFMKIIGRAYTYYSLPAYLFRIEIFQGFLNIATEITKYPFSADEHLTKLKKWAYFFLFKATNKGLKKYFKNPEFVELTRNNDIIRLLFVRFYDVVAEYNSGKAIHPRILAHACDFFALLPENKQTRPLVAENWSALLFNFIIPIQTYSEKIQEIFEYDEESYLKERYNYVSVDIRASTASLFSSMLLCDKKIRLDILNGIIHFLQHNESPAVRYGIIGLLANDQKVIIKAKNQERYSQFIVEQIFRDLRSEHPFLVSQALYFLSLTEQNSVEATAASQALGLVLEIAKRDDGPLPVEAVLAVSFFVHNEFLFETLRPFVPSLFEKTITFSRIYMLESLNSLMEVLVDNYTEEITQFASQFAASISTTVLATLDSSDPNKVASVAGLITTIDRLIINAEDQPGVVYKIYESSEKIIVTIFKQKLEDFYQEAFDLMNSFLFVFQKVAGSMLDIFDLALSVGDEEISFYPREVMDFVDNYLSYGREAIVNAHTLKRIYDTICIFIPDTGEEDLYDENFQAGCRIIDSLMLNTGMAVHRFNPDVIPSILRKLTSTYPHWDSASHMDVYALEAIMNCFVVAPLAAVQCLGNFTTQFIMEAYRKARAFVRVHDKKVFILFTGALFAYSSNLVFDYCEFNEAFVEVLSSLPAAIRNRNKLKETDEGEEADDYEEDASGEDAGFADYEELEEDIYYETVLDPFDPYDFVREMLGKPRPGSVGEVAISKMTPEQVAKIREVLSTVQEKQK